MFKSILVGNLGGDAEVRYTSSGQAVANFSVASTETWKDKDGQKQERTTWVRCALWGKLAEALSQYLVKGKMVYVEGRVGEPKVYQANDGTNKAKLELTVTDIKLLGSGRRGETAGDGDGEPTGQPTGPRTSPAAADESDEIPF